VGPGGLESAPRDLQELSEESKPFECYRVVRPEAVRLAGTRGNVLVSNSVKEQVRALVCEQLGVDGAELTSEANILEDLGADSLDVVELVMAIEETFDIEVPDEDAEGMRTLGDVEKYVTSRVAA